MFSWWIELFANSGDPDQMPHSAAFDLGLHCLPITLLGFPDYNGLMLLFKEMKLQASHLLQTEKLVLTVDILKGSVLALWPGTLRLPSPKRTKSWYPGLSNNFSRFFGSVTQLDWNSLSSTTVRYWKTNKPNHTKNYFEAYVEYKGHH